MTKHAGTARCLAALMLCLASMLATTATAPAVTSPVAETVSETTAPAKAKLQAKLIDKKVKVNAKARVRGVLELDQHAADQRRLEPIVVQRLVAGVWVDVLTTSCRPNYTFRLSLSFSVSANYSLRVFHPSTEVSSDVFVLAVLG